MIEVMFLITAAIFLVVLFMAVESWVVRGLLVAIVAAVDYFAGMPLAMAAGAILAVVLLIRLRIPTVSKL